MHRTVRTLLRHADPILYACWAAGTTLASARMFYGYMLKQTGGEWSAPLDDVFIHFDYARATAAGHPFEWTIGNGYSSGNTSLTYPFVLAAGWLLGFQGERLMTWAAFVACFSIFGLLLAARPLFFEDERALGLGRGDDGWARASTYLLPPAVLGVGALSWSLWSGMEVAFFLATWALALMACLRLAADGAVVRSRARVAKSAWWLGAASALLVTTRPEAAITTAIFAVAAATSHRHGRAGLLLRAGLPATAALVAQAVANRLFTGEWSANGAIVKLALNNPYMTSAEKWRDFVGNLQYASLRNLDYHFAHVEGEYASALVPATLGPGHPLVQAAKTAWWAGVVPLALAMLPLAFRRTRSVAVLLWAQVAAWFAIVALNGQVRWQNERYVMPAIAWMLVLVALGASVAVRGARRARSGAAPALVTTALAAAVAIQVVGVLTRPPGPPHFRFSWLVALAAGVGIALLLRWRAVRVAFVAASLVFAYDHQIPKMRDQKWFFGRAARNIRDQHVTLGRYLAKLRPGRVLVGDAGAVMFEADRPGLDIIGLGGYHDLPFARAGVHGLPATIELIERMPERERPDVLAIFPTWFGVLPTWFTSEVLARFPVEGNVICGGYEQNVYKADWHLLNSGAHLRALPGGDTRVAAEIDVADLVSERRAAYSFDRPANGWTEMRILPDPGAPSRELFDAGRRIAAGRAEHFTLRVAKAAEPAHLVVRTAPEDATRVRVRVGGRDVGTFELARAGEWIESVVAIPREHVVPGVTVDLINEGPGDFVDYHLWLTQ